MSDPMGSPSYRAKARFDAARREARDTLRNAIKAAYLALGDADIAAELAYNAEIDRINAEACAAYYHREAA